MPKNLCTLMMLAATDTKGRLHRMVPENMSYPEKQSYGLYKKVPTEVRNFCVLYKTSKKDKIFNNLRSF